MATRRRRVLTAGVGVLALAGLAALGYFRRHQLHGVLDTLGHLHWEWVPLAILAESGSMVALARSQRQLLTVYGDRLRLGPAVAIVYASNALSLTVPVAGAGLGAGFSFRQFRRRGVNAELVGWALTVSGVMSALSFALVMTVGAGISGNTAAILIGLSGAAISAMPVLVLLAAVRSQRVRVRVLRLANQLVRLSHRWLRHPQPDAAGGLEEILRRVGDVRATPKQYTVAFSLALRNWIGDCLSLLCAVKASGAQVPWHGLIFAYCLAVTAGSAGLTPGGIGVVEATLTAALVGAGMPARYALPAVLVYRLISLWLVVGVGWFIAVRLTRAEKRAGGDADQGGDPRRDQDSDQRHDSGRDQGSEEDRGHDPGEDPGQN